VFVYGSSNGGPEQTTPGWAEQRFLGGGVCWARCSMTLGPNPMAVMAQPAAAGRSAGAAPLIHGETVRVSAAVAGRTRPARKCPFDLHPPTGSSWVTEHGAWVVCGPPRTGGRSPLVPFADWGGSKRRFFSYGSNLCPTSSLPRCDWLDGSGLVTTLAGFGAGVSTRSGWRQGARRDPADGAAGIQPNPAATAGEWCTISTPARSPPASDACEGVAIGQLTAQHVTVEEHRR